MTHTASCQCQQLQVTVEGDLPATSICHCFACQQRTGSVFGVQIRVAAERVQMTGRFTEYTRTGDAGGLITFRFCPTCGATVCWTIDTLPGVVIAAGGFADPKLPAPTFSVYRARKHPWVTIPDSVTTDWD